jgi:hypothetical protein
VLEKHWAYQGVAKVDPPSNSTDWSTHPVDCFVLAKLEEHDLQPVGDASRATLIRRAYFDLLGLPPTPQAIEKFVEDPAPDAYPRLIDRLLASPRYGERWGRYWLDLARYADTAGDNGDFPIPEIYRYRDYVIDSFNSDKPYAVFVREQIAGDLMASTDTSPDERRAMRIATGFIAISRRFGTQPYQFHHLEIEDTLDTLGRAVLGMTFKCARCHDHKFDPITNRDYYALYGIFASSQYPFTGCEGNKQRMNLVPLDHSAEEYAKITKGYKEGVKATIDELNKLGNPGLEPMRGQLDSLRAQVMAAKRAEKPQEEIDAIQKQYDEVDKVLRGRTERAQARLAKLHDDHKFLLDIAAYAVAEKKPTDVQIQLQGNPKELGDLVPRNAPVVLQFDGDLQIPEDASGRLQLADWLASPRNALTSRVMVNRMWKYHFGRGLVETVSNFGISGATPTHPGLLDWLASEFVASGWSIKHMHRLLMTSRTYRLTSESVEANEEIDPGNAYCWQYRRRQLDAEAIRDSMLAVSGDLDLTAAGAHPFPAVKTWDYSQHKPFIEVYPTNKRSVYLMTQRIQRHPYLAIFDGPDTNQSTGDRTESIVPQQALFLMNHPFIKERAKGLSRRVLSVLDEQARIAMAYRLAWGRTPDASEVEKASAYITRYRSQLMADGVQPTEVDAEAWASLSKLLLTANEFLYVD